MLYKKKKQDGSDLGLMYTPQILIYMFTLPLDLWWIGHLNTQSQPIVAVHPLIIIFLHKNRWPPDSLVKP